MQVSVSATSHRHLYLLVDPIHTCKLKSIGGGKDQRTKIENSISTKQLMQHGDEHSLQALRQLFVAVISDSPKKTLAPEAIAEVREMTSDI